jgi:hypothetical protein
MRRMKMEASTKDEQVNHPYHYTTGGLEVIDVIKAKLTPEEWKGYLKGNCLKYLLRADYKGQDVDIRKMIFYAKLLEACYYPASDEPGIVYTGDGPDIVPISYFTKKKWSKVKGKWTANDSNGHQWELDEDNDTWHRVK